MNANSLKTASATDELRLAAVRRELDLLPSSELPKIAASALEAGLDSPSLRELAGELDPTWGDCETLFARALCEVDVCLPPIKSEVAHLLACHYAEQIVAGIITPEDGAHKIWSHVANRFWDDKELWQHYAVFIGLASELEDNPVGRIDYERRIRVEAAKILDPKPRTGS